MKFHIGGEVLDISVSAAKRLLQCMQRTEIKDGIRYFNLPIEPDIEYACHDISEPWDGYVAVKFITIDVLLLDCILDHLSLQINRAEPRNQIKRGYKWLKK